MKRILAASAAIFLLGGVSACGLTGDLKRPGPLIGGANEVDPVTLPDADNKNLPELPDRPSDPAAGDADDELLGGPGTR